MNDCRSAASSSPSRFAALLSPPAITTSSFALDPPSSPPPVSPTATARIRCLTDESHRLMCWTPRYRALYDAAEASTTDFCEQRPPVVVTARGRPPICIKKFLDRLETSLSGGTLIREPPKRGRPPPPQHQYRYDHHHHRKTPQQQQQPVFTLQTQLSSSTYHQHQKQGLPAVATPSQNSSSSQPSSSSTICSPFQQQKQQHSMYGDCPLENGRQRQYVSDSMNVNEGNNCHFFHKTVSPPHHPPPSSSGVDVVPVIDSKEYAVYYTLVFMHLSENVTSPAITSPLESVQCLFSPEAQPISQNTCTLKKEINNVIDYLKECEVTEQEEEEEEVYILPPTFEKKISV